MLYLSDISFSLCLYLSSTEYGGQALSAVFVFSTLWMFLSAQFTFSTSNKCLMPDLIFSKREMQFRILRSVRFMVTVVVDFGCR